MENNGEEEDDINEENEQIKQLEEFYSSFAYKLEIFDPLNRPIDDESGLDQTMKVEELLDTIKKMPIIKGKDIDMPLSSNLHALFERQLEEEF